MSITVELLGKQLGKAAFCCGQPALDDWFHHRASQDMRKKVAQVYVAIERDLGIVGFYSLSTCSLDIADLPEQLSRKLPRYDAIPAVLIGRLARDIRVRGKGYGELLLADAIVRLCSVADQIGIYAILVDAIDANAARFYEGFGFQCFSANPNRMFLPMATAMAGLEASLPQG